LTDFENVGFFLAKKCSSPYHHHPSITFPSPIYSFTTAIITNYKRQTPSTLRISQQ
jgi:hypothetical protein